MSQEMITFAIGILSLLAILSEKAAQIPAHLFSKLSARTRRALSVLVAVGIVASMTSQTIQYVYASTSNSEKRRIEREYARVIYLFSENKLDLTAQFLKDKQYIAGYQAYRNKDYVAAKGYFVQSIARDEFVPESRYLLAYMHLLQNEKAGEGDLSEAMKEVTKAISQDRRYSAPYYLRGILEVKGSLFEKGLDDLEFAVMSDGTACYDIQQSDEIDRWWRTVAKHARFASIQAECKAKWGLSHKVGG